MASIPPNEDTNPRWLLDLDNWALCEYRNIREDVAKQGYGIISYTWGLYRDGTNSVERELLPRGVVWDVPKLKQTNNRKSVNITFERTVAAVKTMQVKYVWWDWMCVPQVPKDSPYAEAAGEEIGKQMIIYRQAKKSIVWLHDTAWYGSSHIKSLLLFQSMPTQASEVEGFCDTFLTLIKNSQRFEPWLTSIWTLQEGVLLQETPLIDCKGEELLDDKFLSDRIAIVQDISRKATLVAGDIASALLSINERPAPTTLVSMLQESPQLQLKMQKFLANLIKTGIVAYNSGLALFILAGRFSRRTTPDNKDNFWALVGALDLHDVKVSYDEKLSYGDARLRFFEPLLERHQWQLFITPALPEVLRQATWPEVISDGHLFPLGMYFRIDLLDNLPEISWNEGLIRVMPNKSSQGVSILTWSKYICRRYIQHQDQDDLPLVDVVGPEESAPAGDTVYLPIGRVDSRTGIAGKLCIELKKWSTTQSLARGTFNGVVDIWPSGKESTSHVLGIIMDL